MAVSVILFLLCALNIWAQDQEDAAATLETKDEAFLKILAEADRETDLAKASALLEQALSGETEKSRRYELLSRLAVLYELSGNVESAQRYYESAAFIRDDERDFKAFYRSAVLLLAMGHSDRAEMQAMTLAASQDSVLTRKAEFLLLYISAVRGNKPGFETQLARIRLSGGTEPVAPSEHLAPSELYILFRAYGIMGDDKAAEETKLDLLSQYPSSLESSMVAPSGGFQAARPYPEPFMFLSETSDPAEDYIQVGLFTREENAREMAARLSESGFARGVVPVLKDGRQYFKVVVPLKAAADRQETAIRLKDAGFEAF